MAHLHFCQHTDPNKKMQKSHQTNAPRHIQLDGQYNDRKEGRTANSTYKKLAVQWLNEALCFVSSFVVVDSFVLRNRQLLVAANRYAQCYERHY